MDDKEVLLRRMAKKIERVLAQYGAGLFTSDPIVVWIDGEYVGEIENEEGGDGSRLVVSFPTD